MLDERTLRRKVALRLAGSAGTLLPLMGGVTVLIAGWALGWNPAVGWFGVLAGGLAAAGAYVTRLLLGGDVLTRRIAEELVREEKRAKESALDELDKRLATSDKDPRPETALRDLRSLLRSFEEHALLPGSAHSHTMVEVHSMVSRLFDQCVYSLRQTEVLWQTAQRLQTPEARKPIQDQREQLLKDVQATLQQLSDALVAVQKLGAGPASQGEWRRLRDELDEGLAVAKIVEERVNDFIKDVDVTHTGPVVNQERTKGPSL